MKMTDFLTHSIVLINFILNLNCNSRTIIANYFFIIALLAIAFFSLLEKRLLDYYSFTRVLVSIALVQKIYFTIALQSDEKLAAQENQILCV